MKTLYTHKKQHQGFSLVELMIAATIGLLLMSAVISLFLSSNHSSQQTSMRSGIYENGRYALSTMSDELKLAEFWGGAQAVEITPSDTLDAIATDCTQGAMGYDFGTGATYTYPGLWATTATTADVVGCISDAEVGSDVVVIKRVAEQPTALADVDTNKTYIMSNSVTGMLFDGDDTPPTTTAIGGDVPNGQAWEYIVAIYYVANNAEGIPTLFRKSLSGNTWGSVEEVALGVEKMHLQFGVDSTGDGVANSFRDATNAAWDDDDNYVVSAHIYLLIRSEAENAASSDTKTYQLGSVSIGAPSDHYQRVVFDTTVNLRNLSLMAAGGF